MRGKAAVEGATMTSANGYHYTHTATAWRLTHHIIAEKKLGRAINSETELVAFDDKDRTNLDPSNIVVKEKHKQSANRKRARIEARIADLQAELDELGPED